MKIALIQQGASPDRDANVKKGLANLERAVAQGAEVICFAELAFTPFYPQEKARLEKLRQEREAVRGDS